MVQKGELPMFLKAYADHPEQPAEALRVYAEGHIDQLMRGYRAFEGHADAQAHFLKALVQLQDQLDQFLNEIP